MAEEKITGSDALKEAFLEYDKSVLEFNEAVFVTCNSSTYEEVQDAVSKGKILAIVDDGIVCPVSKYVEKETSIEMHVFVSVSPLDGVYMMFYRVSNDDSWYSFEYNYAAKSATEVLSGTIKLNPDENIYLDEDGRLVVDGRLGTFPDGGVYYPSDIDPSGVGSSSFLMSDGAKNLSVGARTFGIMAGVNLTCKNTAAGSTTYRASNSQSNRFICAAVVGGRAALSQADAKENGTAAIVSIKYANGDDLTTPYFGATESGNDIIITLDRTVNPDAATKALRLYGTNVSTDNILVGQGVAAGGGKALSLGQATFAGGNQCIAFGNCVYVIANNSVGFGHTMLINKQFCFGAGQGHDFTNASPGTAAFGTYSELGDTTKLAIGDGTAFDARSNIFEVRAVSGASQLLVKSPNGTKYAIIVDDSGNITTEAI